jgi:hypothetical protein
MSEDDAILNRKTGNCNNLLTCGGDRVRVFANASEIHRAAPVITLRAFSVPVAPSTLSHAAGSFIGQRGRSPAVEGQKADLLV